MPDRGFASAEAIINQLAREQGLTRQPDESDWAFRQRVRTVAAAAPIDWEKLKNSLAKITSPKTIAWLERWRKK